jgi:hypothetical protein
MLNHIMLSVVMLNVVMLSVVMLNVVMLNVVTPIKARVLVIDNIKDTSLLRNMSLCRTLLICNDL